VRHLRHAQPRAIGHAQRGALLDARRRREQPADLLDVEDIGQLAGIPDLTRT
jgi:hypothetical protein